MQTPVLFIGHGSPMNAIEDNAYTRTLTALGKTIDVPKAILCISAHWLTDGTYVTAMKHPKTIHDFFGFPKPLFDVQYAALGSPEIAQLVVSSVKDIKVQLTQEWGLDHGTWSVMKHLYPEANIPVLQLSIDQTKPAEHHLKLGEGLRSLREQGVLIVGSGNIVHNLRRLNWDSSAAPFSWAVEFDQWVKTKMEKREFYSLATDFAKTEAGRLSVPTTEHYFPLLYALGASFPSDALKFEFEGIDLGSIGMRSLSFGR